MIIETKNFTFVNIMIRYSEKTRQLAGLFLEALMLVFIFNFSWSEVNYADKHSENKLVFSAIQADEISFYDSDSSSESILNFLSKGQIYHSVYVNNCFDLFGISLTKADGFSISHSLFNTFYTHITASAP